MKESVLHLFEQHAQLAFIISLAISVLIAVLGVVPSVFVTAANILFFGFWQGTLLSFLGEALGAAVAFVLYRKGFKKTAAHQLQKFPKAKTLVEAEGQQAFLLILSLRLLPFVPSGLITFAAAIGSVSVMNFLVASSLGKIPALLLEAISVYQAMQFGWLGKLMLLIIAACLVYFIIKDKRKH